MARPLSADATPADRIGALLPAEVTGLYVSMRALFEAPGIPNQPYYVLGCAAVALGVGILYIRFARQVTNPVHLAVYALLFANWAFALDANLLQPALPSVPLAAITGAASFILSFLFPLVIPSRTVASQPAP